MTIKPRIKKVLSSNWFIIGGLIFLSLVPSVAGTVRLSQIATDADITPERFSNSPFPVAVHISSVIFYAILGAFQFAPQFRRNHKKWHRVSGKFLILCGFSTALSGLWMTHFYPWPEFDGQALYVMRLLVGFGMLLSLVLAMFAIKQRKFTKHGNWMIRAYALAMGAGTQVFTHIPWAIFPDLQSELFRAVCMGAGWLINIVIAEWIIQAKTNHKTQQKLNISPQRSISSL